MASYLNMGLKTLKSILEVARSCHIKVIYNISKGAKFGGLLFALRGTFDDDNVWIIDNGALRHMTGESG